MEHVVEKCNYVAEPYNHVSEHKPTPPRKKHVVTMMTKWWLVVVPCWLDAFAQTS